jgi:hypothetical protein
MPYNAHLKLTNPSRLSLSAATVALPVGVKPRITMLFRHSLGS